MKKIFSFLVRVIVDTPVLSELIYLTADYEFEKSGMARTGAYLFYTNSMQKALTAMATLRQLKDTMCIEVLRNVPSLTDPEGSYELIAEYSSKGYKKACEAVAKAAAAAKQTAEMDEAIKELTDLRDRLNGTDRKKRTNHKKNG